MVSVVAFGWASDLGHIQLILSNSRKETFPNGKYLKCAINNISSLTFTRNIELYFFIKTLVVSWQLLHLAFIHALHSPIDNFTVLSHLVALRFLKGLESLPTSIEPGTIMCNNMVLIALMNSVLGLLFFSPPLCEGCLPFQLSRRLEEF